MFRFFFSFSLFHCQKKNKQALRGGKNYICSLSTRGLARTETSRERLYPPAMASASTRRLAVLRSHLAESAYVDRPIASTSSPSSSPDACPSSSPRSVPLRVLSAAEAVADIRDGDIITVIENLQGIERGRHECRDVKERKTSFKQSERASERKPRLRRRRRPRPRPRPQPPFELQLDFPGENNDAEGDSIARKSRERDREI